MKNHSRTVQPQRIVVYGYLVFFALIGICIARVPASLTANSGISYFADFRSTLFMYVLAYVIAALTFVWIGVVFRKQVDFRWFAFIYWAMAVLMVGLIATPHITWNLAHRFFGSSLFIIQLMLSGWCYVHSRYNRRIGVLLLIEFLAGVGAAFSLSQDIGYMIQYQFLFQLGFAGVMYIWTRYYYSRK